MASEYANVCQNPSLDAGTFTRGLARGRFFTTGSHPNSLVTRERVTIVLIKGNICDQMVDALANSVGGEFNLSSGVISKALLQQAGQKIQDELTSMKPRKTCFGDVVATGGYKLNASWVFHGVLKKWNQGRDDAEQILRCFIRNVLNECEKRNLRKVAFPTVGCGALAFPADVVASCLFEECDKYSANNPSPALSEVRVVVFSKDLPTFNAFEAKVSQLQMSPSVQLDSDSGTDDDTASSSDDDVFSSHFLQTLIKGLSTRVKKQDRSGDDRNGSQTCAAGIACPPNWAPPDPLDPYRKITLTDRDKEYKAVEQNARRLGRGSLNRIVKIERVENPNLWKLYMVTKENMTRANGNTVENERLLWHGTASDSIVNICAGGFNRAYCGKNATMFGNGVYFAKDFAYSAQDTYSPKDPKSGYKHVFQCRVLTGQFTVGKSGMIEPPPRDGSNIRVRYDSVSDNVRNPSLWVVFRDTHAYPEYLITFT
jgi:poly [ADP-ribose] polymerase 10/14/15